MLDKIGETTPPCGAPEYVACHVKSSRYPARSMPATRPKNLPSWMFSARMSSMTSWSRLPKQSAISPSMNQVVPVHVESDLIESRMATSPHPEPMRPFRELRLVVGLE